MLLRNPGFFLCTYTKSQNFSNFQQSPSFPLTSAAETCPPHRGSSTRFSHPKRHHATIRDDKPNAGEIQWPKTTSVNAIPTPYQIFQQKRTDPYSKRRFYELVKIYHPDRRGCENNDSRVSSLPYAVLIDRYRLVVAANDILSHPAKRKAYDECGAGWNGHPEAKSRRDQWSYDSDRRWTGFEDNNTSPFRNATWEDWEKWYQRNDTGKRQPQEPVYFSNGGFLSLIAIFACLGGIGQATRIGDQKISYLKQVENVHADCSQDTRRRMEQAQGYGNKDSRVEGFLKTREQASIPLSYSSEDDYRRLLPPPDPH